MATKKKTNKKPAKRVASKKVVTHTYSSIAKLLASKLTKDELVQLAELSDDDVSNSLDECIQQECAKVAPEVYEEFAGVVESKLLVDKGFVKTTISGDSVFDVNLYTRKNKRAKPKFIVTLDNDFVEPILSVGDAYQTLIDDLYETTNTIRKAISCLESDDD